MPVNREQQRRVEAILREPDLYPDEFKSWLPRFLEGNPNYRLTSLQLPQVESIRYVGSTGEAAFSGTWVNYGAGYEEAGYYKDPFGRVHLSGLVKSGAVASTIFVLPGGFRPKARHMFAVEGNDVIARVDVTAAGDVIFVNGNSAFVQLSGISFRAYS